MPENFNQLIREPWTPDEELANMMRALFAIAWTFAWGTLRWLFHKPRGWTFWQWRRMAFAWGRHESPKAAYCEQCGWIGPYRWLVHGYAGCGNDDVEPIDECPRCGSTDMDPLLKRRNGAWCS
jgi:hypothetical protein